MSSEAINNTNTTGFDFHYGNESEQYTFFKVPKIFFSDEQFSDMSLEAKILYSLMLDRMSLSRANGWSDSYNRIYIIFPISCVIDMLGCGKGKACKIMKELETIGLIERERRGLCKPDLIYVKKFTDQTENPERPHKELDLETGEYYEDTDNYDEYSEQLGYSEPVLNRTTEYRELNSCVSENEPQEFFNLDTNKTDNIKTDSNKTNDSNNKTIDNDMDVDKENTRAIEAVYTKIKDQISYDALAKQYGMSTVNSFVENLVDIALMHDDGAMIEISKHKYPISLVKYRFSRIDYDIADYILDSIQHTSSKVKYLKRYMITTLFNACSTIDTKYQLEVNHDMASGKFADFMSQRMPA